MSGNESPGVGDEVPVERDLYPVAEAAQRLGIHESTAWRLIAKGELRTVKLWGRRLVPPEAIDELKAKLIAEARA